MKKTVIAIFIVVTFLSFGTNLYAYHVESNGPYGFDEHWDEVEVYYDPGSGYSVSPMGNVIGLPFSFIVMPDAGDKATGLINVGFLLSLTQNNSLEVDNFDPGGYTGHTIKSAGVNIDQSGLFKYFELSVVPGLYAISTAVEIGEWCNVQPVLSISGCLYGEDWYTHVIDETKSGYVVGKYSTKLEIIDPEIVVPEPSTMLLLIAGLIGLAGLRKKIGIR